MTPTSKSIGALVEGLSYAHSHTRRFIWYLDGIKKAEEAVPPPITQHGYTIAPVYFASEHRVKVEIYNSTKTVLFFSEEKTTSTLYPSIIPWSWTASNGEATVQQTQTAKTALDTVGQVSDFHYKIWDDFIRKIAESREETGQAWLSTYATEAAALVGEAFGELTVARYNAAVQNIAYPYWTWERDPLAIGYLGRLLVRGTATMGANADTVYAAYLLELAHKLNVVIGIYNNTGDIVDLNLYPILAVSTALALRAPVSRPISLSSNVSISGDINLSVRLPKLLQASANLNISASVDMLKDLIRYLSITGSLAISTSNQMAAVQPKTVALMSALTIVSDLSAAAVVPKLLSINSLLSISSNAAIIKKPSKQLELAAALSFQTECDLFLKDLHEIIVTASIALSNLLSMVRTESRPITLEDLHNVFSSSAELDRIAPSILGLSGNITVASSIEAVKVLPKILFLENINATFSAAAQINVIRPKALQPLTGSLSFSQSNSLVKALICYMTVQGGITLDQQLLLVANGNVAAMIVNNNIALSSSTALSTSEPKAVSLSSRFTLNSTVSLEAQPKVTWDDPIEIEDGLYIRQVYAITETANTLILE